MFYTFQKFPNPLAGRDVMNVKWKELQMSQSSQYPAKTILSITSFTQEIVEASY